MFDTIRIDTDARGVATLTLARPDKHNALNAAMIADLTEAATRLGADASVRVVVLAAEGKSFCAGGDLAWMQAQMQADRAARAREAGKLAAMLGALNSLPKPLIGRVQGPAYGGGVGMMAVCDIAVGAQDTRFGFTETRLGLIPATIGPYVVAKMGASMARRVFLSARIFDAAEAVTLGLLARAVPSDALDAAVAAEIAPYLDCAPQAVARAKGLVHHLGTPISAAQIEHSITELVTCWEGDEAREGIAAFFERRKPGWAR